MKKQQLIEINSTFIDKCRKEEEELAIDTDEPQLKNLTYRDQACDTIDL